MIKILLIPPLLVDKKSLNEIKIKKDKIFIKIQKYLSILLLPTFSKISETKYLY